MSQPDVRTFKAATMQEALDLVRRELGPDAVILQTRELTRSRFFPWRKTRERIEITAGLGVQVRVPKPVAAPVRKAPGAVPTVAARPLTAPVISIPAVTESALAPEQLAPAPRLLPELPVRPDRVPTASVSTARAALVPAPQPANRLERGPAVPVPVPASQTTLPLVPAAAPGAPQETISRKLTAIEQMVSQLTRGSLHQAADIPPELFELYTELIESEFEEQVARELIQRIKTEIRPDAVVTAASARARLRTMVETQIRCAPPISVHPGRRRVVALVGPTGVGKTTTIAKLAANFRLRDGVRMGLVTVDTYRIAAVEQLRTYAEIIDLPMKVVTTPREMRRALDELAGLDLVLIDTAGRSPRDDLRIQELKSLLAEAQVDEVHLVLSLASSARTLEATAEKFASAGTTSLILTKLDEAIGMGALLSVAQRIPLPVSYLTTGQDVPDDIEHAAAQRMARLILGEEPLAGRRQYSTQALA